MSCLNIRVRVITPMLKLIEGTTGQYIKNYVVGDYQFIEMDAGHWIIQEKYQELTGHLLDHLAKYK
jgi:hypothetical protein